jgi:hypothetical protein
VKKGKKNAEKNKGGRPSKFERRWLPQVRKLAGWGATEERIAEFFGVCIATITNWKRDYPEFLAALKAGKDEADERVVQGLYERAVGYSHKDTDIRAVSLGQGMGSQIVQTPIVKYYPPDPTAAIFWLKNRRPKDWRDKVQHEVADADGQNLGTGLAVEIAKAILAGKEGK